MDNKYRIIGKTSKDLSEKEWNDLTVAFNEVFHKKFTISYFQDKYLKTHLKFSIHGFLLFDEQIVGMFSIIPRLYGFCGEKRIIGLGCDAFILKEYRKDDFFLKEMADAAYKVCRENNVFYLISIPNQTAYPYWKYYGEWHDIATLDYYILPYRISGLLKTNRIFDYLSMFFFSTVLSVSRLLDFGKKSVPEKKINLVRDEQFLLERYNRADNYKIYRTGEKKYFIAREYDEDGIKTIYIVDCCPLSHSMLNKALYQIVNDCKGRFDIILYVGKTVHPPFYFFKVPKSKEPRVQYFTGYPLTEERKNDFLDISSWNVCLADFDNR